MKSELGLKRKQHVTSSRVSQLCSVLVHVLSLRVGPPDAAVEIVQSGKVLLEVVHPQSLNLRHVRTCAKRRHAGANAGAGLLHGLTLPADQALTRNSNNALAIFRVPFGHHLFHRIVLDISNGFITIHVQYRLAVILSLCLENQANARVSHNSIPRLDKLSPRVTNKCEEREFGPLPAKDT